MGNIIEDSQAQAAKTLHYGAPNRLKKVAIGDDGKEVHYVYKAKGHRVSKTFEGVTTHFQNDIANRLITETVADAYGYTRKREFMYAEGQRVAMVDYAQAPDEQLLFVVNDHLGTPHLLMNMHEEVVWRMITSPFGELAANDGVKQPLRFLGQYGGRE